MHLYIFGAVTKIFLQQVQIVLGLPNGLACVLFEAQVLLKFKASIWMVFHVLQGLAMGRILELEIDFIFLYFQEGAFVSMK